MLLSDLARTVSRALVLLTTSITLALTPASAASNKQVDPKFQSLFQSWQRLDQVAGTAAPGAIAIPSQKPIENITLSSGFGVRADPFRHTAAMHAGVDLPGAMGTPVYATADGVVARAEWASGYGKLIEVTHGKGIATRYAHLSQIMVEPNTRVKRGDLIGLMGSTGRSTGSHLHYEVRIDGRAVNPMPFLEGDDYMIALAKAEQMPGGAQVALGGPDVGAPEGSGDQ